MRVDVFICLIDLVSKVGNNAPNVLLLGGCLGAGGGVGNTGNTSREIQCSG